MDVANDIRECTDESAAVFPENVFRLGSASTGRPRPLKLRFKTTDLARLGWKTIFVEKKDFQ